MIFTALKLAFGFMLYGIIIGVVECYDQQDTNLKCEADNDCESLKKCVDGECKECPTSCKTCDGNGYCVGWCHWEGNKDKGLDKGEFSLSYSNQMKSNCRSNNLTDTIDCRGCDKSCTENIDCPDIESCYNGICQGCSWLVPTSENSVLKCIDGTYCNAITDKKGWSCCKEHYGRAKCPKDIPIMCSLKLCVDDTDYCCSTEDTNCDEYKDPSSMGDRGDDPRPCEAYFEFYEGNNRTEDLLCTVPIEAVEANKKKMGDTYWIWTTQYVGYGCENNEARSLVLCNGMVGTKITVFDDDEFSLDDDWAVITVIKSFVGCITIPTFEKTQYVGVSEQVYVNYVTDGNLDGKVSSFTIELPKTKRVTLQAKEELKNGEDLVTSNKKYALRMQNDGNLVLYKTNWIRVHLNSDEDGMIGPYEAIWASDTSGVGEKPYRLVMQEDNHLVVYGKGDEVIWRTDVYIRDPQQWKKPGFAAVQDDGNFVVYDGVWDAMWASNTQNGTQGMYGEGNKQKASCNSKCEKCETGEKNGEPCNDWCSMSGYCGSSTDYQYTDCSACPCTSDSDCASLMECHEWNDGSKSCRDD